MTSSEDQASTPQQPRINLRYLMHALLKFKASDLHLKVGRSPIFRVKGKLIPAKMDAITKEKIKALVLEILTEKQMEDLEVRKQLDYSFEIADLGRFRCNVYFQKGLMSVAVRMIPQNIPDLDALNLPPVLKEMCHKVRGLVLVTGATGAGKSTTMAAMIQYINQNRNVHIICLEDPMEYVFRDIKSSITQREIGSDAISYKDALIGALRQDPDVIMIGELRDAATIQAALTAAETGHLVLATLHTNDAKSSIDRILDVFPPDAQGQIRVQLASTLVGVVSQMLMLRADSTGQIPACEIMVNSPAIESYIRKNELENIPQSIATSSHYYKMQTMNQALHQLINAGTVLLQEALKSSPSPDDLKLLLSGVDRSEGYNQN